MNQTNADFETILVLQGGGSLGAYECGVYKTLYKYGIKFDILAGSSIGAVNASIITAAQNSNKNAADILESFWLTLAENISPFEFNFELPFLSFDKKMALWSSMYSMFYGNSKAFVPKWLKPDSRFYFDPSSWTYLYDLAPLKKTLKDYIDFKSLGKIQNSEKNGFNSKTKNKNTKNKLNWARLIITATDIQKGEPVIFDNLHTDIDGDMILASAGFPFYGLRWIIKDERYLWDGSLLTNTPMMDVMRASPIRNKKFYIVDVFPRQQKEIPTNMIEVWHRARDIIFMDKTDKNIEMIKISEKYLNLLKKMYGIVNFKSAKIDEDTKDMLNELGREYNELTQKHGAAIIDVTRIGRKERDSHYLFEDADFSKYRIKKLIEEGEKDAENKIREADGNKFQNK
ncbi:MAG: patatin-like phospholipase family protein [Candidatus Nitrosocosmicus sp.]|nr:patatin-like phospholipase family protein [Candidatus Nitrosocosmicus sp.]MDN5867010.1 patatin-like phospholipase family protein [Candidatus Nitrosocosmicus sp.]